MTGMRKKTKYVEFVSKFACSDEKLPTEEDKEVKNVEIWKHGLCTSGRKQVTLLAGQCELQSELQWLRLFPVFLRQPTRVRKELNFSHQKNCLITFCCLILKISTTDTMPGI